MPVVGKCCGSDVELGKGTGFDHKFDCKAFFEGRQGHPCKKGSGGILGSGAIYQGDCQGTDSEIASLKQTICKQLIEAKGLCAGIAPHCITFDDLVANFYSTGCSEAGCEFSGEGDDLYKCALNLSDAMIRSGFALPSAANVNLCSHGRVRNADGMARTLREMYGQPRASGWPNRPTWKGFVYFEGGPRLGDATGHVDLWDGKDPLHRAYDDAKVIWFWPFE